MINKVAENHLSNTLSPDHFFCKDHIYRNIKLQVQGIMWNNSNRVEIESRISTNPSVLCSKSGNMTVTSLGVYINYLVYYQLSY